MKAEVPIRRIKIMPLYGTKGSYEQYYLCPCGQNCVRKMHTIEGESEFYVDGPCAEQYHSIHINKRSHMFELKS